MELHEIEELDAVDAMVFSGDKLHDRETLELFKRTLLRWMSQALVIDEVLRDEVIEEDGFTEPSQDELCKGWMK